jgi:hypothetical protein
MTKAKLNKLTAVKLGSKGLKVDTSPVGKAVGFSKFGKPGAGEEVTGLVSLTVDGVTMKYAMIEHNHGGVTIGANGKHMAALSL